MNPVRELYAYLAVREDGTEKPIAIVSPDGNTIPCVATSREIVEQLLPFVQIMVDRKGVPATLARFTERENLEIIPPDGEANEEAH